LYQLEYHMTTLVKSVRARPSVAAAALLAAWFTFGGSQIARAEDPETIAPPAQETILVPAQEVHALQERVAYLEETVAALTESWQHIDTHRLCVADDTGAETCITKAQLDVFLSQSAHAQISEPVLAQEAKLAPAAQANEAAEIVAAAPTSPASEPTVDPSAEPATVVSENPLPQPEPEITGTVAPASATEGDALAPAPKLEVYEEPAAKSED
jgi:hypothetical protein